jgi:hypothetical protein
MWKPWKIFMVHYWVSYASDSQYNMQRGSPFSLYSAATRVDSLYSFYRIGRKEHIQSIVLEAGGSFVGYTTSTMHDVIYLPTDTDDNL